MGVIETGRGNATVMNTYIKKKWLPSRQYIGICNRYEYIYGKQKDYC
jgi:hypothetical protein